MPTPHKPRLRLAAPAIFSFPLWECHSQETTPTIHRKILAYGRTPKEAYDLWHVRWQWHYQWPQATTADQLRYGLLIQPQPA